MAYLNEQQRDQLLNELKNMTFNQANAKLRRMDKRGRLAFYRNAQQTGRWLTRYHLDGLGTRVTLVEKHSDQPDRQANRTKSTFEFVEVIVEPTPDNRS
ncbi:MAG: hypothetical protein K8I30_10880 [Anaerolineae bacterium]|nr:hypothetical protein [Anaerolineae bacterium]